MIWNGWIEMTGVTGNEHELERGYEEHGAIPYGVGCVAFYLQSF